MTTLVHPTPPLAAAGARPFPQIDLPSGPSPQPAAALADPAPRKPELLAWLLAGAAVTGVLGVIGAGVVTVLLRSSHPAQPTGDWVGLPQAVSPQHAPAQPSQPAPARPTPNAPAPAGTGSPPVPAAAVPAAVTPTPSPVPAPSTTPRSGADDLRALKQSGPYAPPAPPRPATPAVAAVAAASPTQVLPAHPPATAQPDAKAIPTADPASLAGTLTNPDLGAAPAPQALIDMVAALASDIAQEQKGDVEMHQQIESLLRDTDHRLSEFDRRLSVVEASPSPTLAKTGSGRASAKPVSASADAFSDMRAALSATPPLGGRRYEIRAASPGVAVLGTLDGTPAVIEIAVGDQVPGYGRVNAIGQKGHAWAVLCEHGTIQ